MPYAEADVQRAHPSGLDDGNLLGCPGVLESLCQRRGRPDTSVTSKQDAHTLHMKVGGLTSRGVAEK